MAAILSRVDGWVGVGDELSMWNRNTMDPDHEMKLTSDNLNGITITEKPF